MKSFKINKEDALVCSNWRRLIESADSSSDDNNNNNKHDNVYGAVIMAEPLREFTRFI